MDKPIRNELGQLVKGGGSLNPSGRPKGLMKKVRELTQEGESLAEIMHKIANGEEVFGNKPSLSEIMRAIEYLSDRGFGKATQTNLELSKEDINIEVTVKAEDEEYIIEIPEN